MAEFQIIETQRSIPGASPSVQGHVPTDTGAAAVFRAWEKLGINMFNLVRDMYELDGDAELTQTMFEINEKSQQLHIDLLNETNPEEHLRQYQAFAEEVKSTQLRNGIARQKFQRALPTYLNSQASAAFQSYKDRILENHNMALASAKALAIRTGNMLHIESLLSTREDMSQDEKNLILADTKNRAEVNIINGFLRSNDYDKALLAIDQSSLDQKTKRSLESSTLAQQKSANEEARRIKAEEQEETADQFDAKIAVGAEDKPTLADLALALKEDRITFSRFRSSATLLENPPTEKTQPMTQIKINLIKRGVTAGDFDLQNGLNQYLRLVGEIDPDENQKNINDIFAAAKDSEDDTKRQNATILGEREKKLRDSIEADPSIFVRPEERDLLRDLANDAVIELNDRFRGMDFTAKEIDVFTDELKAKYSISRQAIIRARKTQDLIKAKSFKEQVAKTQELLRTLRNEGRIAELRDAIDEAVKLGLANPDGTPSTEQREPVKTKGIIEILRER